MLFPVGQTIYKFDCPTTQKLHLREATEIVGTKLAGFYWSVYSLLRCSKPDNIKHSSPKYRRFLLRQVTRYSRVMGGT